MIRIGILKLLIRQLLLPCVLLWSLSACGSTGDTVVPASKQYHRSPFYTLLFGKNYRRDWETPVTMPRLDIKSQQLKLVSLKGGMESISMNMATRDSTQMVLRTVDKSMKKIMPKALKNSPQEAIMQDVISASEPYAALTVPVMCDALGITHATPTLYYVNDSANFGKYYPYFAGRVCMLEERIPKRPGTKHEEMDAPFTAPQRDNHNIVLQREVLKARLLDMLCGDWDRHPGQWNWGSFDSAGNKFLYPVPVDRDMVYFNSDGVFIKFIRLWSMHMLRGFKPKMKKMYQFNKISRNFDRELLNRLSAEDWDQTVREVQFKLTDAVIDAAVNHLPREVLVYRGDEIKKTMKSRRNGLYPAAMQYYRRLAKKVYILSSDKTDYFRVTNNNGNAEIEVYDSPVPIEKNLIYRRKFGRNTKHIYLVGVGNDDKIGIASDAGIKISVIKDSQPNRHRFDIRARNRKRLGKSVNTLGQPGFKS